MTIISTFMFCVAIAYGLLCLAVALFQNRLIFFPSTQMETTPHQRGWEYEEVWLPMTGEGEIHGWWIPNPKTRKVLLYLHGNSENMSSNLTQAEPYHHLGFSIFMMDYRSYGKSRGKFPTESQVYADAQRGWQYLTQERQIPPQNIIVFGHSLGGAIAIELATRHPEIPGLIIEGSFTSIQDTAGYKKRYRFLPLPLLVHQQFHSLQKVPHLPMPLLFIHGTQDPVIPPAMSQALYEAVSHSRKQLCFIPEGYHHNIVNAHRQKYLQTVEQFTSTIWAESKSS